MNKTEVSQLQFRGCLLGVLVGDCLGLPFETFGRRKVNYALHEKKVQAFFDKLLTIEDSNFRQYSDDTSMTISVAQSLIKCRKFEVLDVAQTFTEAFFSQTKKRGYGPKVRKVFRDLRKTNFKDIFRSASEQFDGQGSLGNGSGMRVGPIALYTINDPDLSRFTFMTVQTSRITHTNPKGIVGGIFQALAIRHALLHGIKWREGNVPINPIDILNDFEKDFELLAEGKIELPSTIPSFQSGYECYREKLKIMRELLLQGNGSLKAVTVANTLGSKVTAPESVPTAFFCFLAAFNDIPFIKAANQFQRTIQLAIALGYDTDTIGAMAGAIAGGFLGENEIPVELVAVCEDFEGVTELGSKLFAMI